MCDWNTLVPHERITKWKKFRQAISEFSESQKTEAVARFFATVPIGRRTVDYYTPDSWSSPWEILHERSYCQSSTSIVMYHSIKMVSDMKVDMALIDDGNDMYLIPVIDDLYTMNYELGAVSDWCEIQKLVDVKGYFTEEEIKQII